MSELPPFVQALTLIAIVALSICTVVFVLDRLIDFLADRSRRQPEPKPWQYESPPEPEIDPDLKFCRDCGKSFAMQRSQYGFDPKTGEPHYIYALGCPDGAPGRMSRRTVGSVTLALAAGMPISDWPNCGNMQTSPFSPATTHDHPDPVSTNCAACIGDMLDNGAIDNETARKLTAALP